MNKLVDEIVIETTIKVPQEISEILNNPSADKVYTMDFLGHKVSVSIAVRLNPILMMLMANVEFIHISTKNGLAYLMSLKNNYGMVLPSGLEDQLIEILKK